MNIKETIKASPSYRWFILANVSIGTFMATLDSSIVNVALPTMSSQLKVELSTLQWVVTAYLLAISSLLPIFGRLADLLGRKRVYLTGFLIFTLGSALCGFSNNVWILVGMRIIQAIGAAMIMANGPAIITSTFPPQERGRALGLVGTVVALGGLTGPGVGGVLVGLADWQAIFFVNIPIGIFGFLVGQVILPTDKIKREKESFDFQGAALFTLGMISLLFALNNGQDWGWSSLPIVSGLILGIFFLALFFAAEHRVAYPIIDLSLFRIRPFLVGNLSGLLSFISSFSNTMLMPFYLQHILNFAPTKVGLIMTSFPLVMAVVAPISGYISDRIGPMALTTGGLILSASGLFYLSTVTVSSTVLHVIPGPILMGLGAGLFNSPNNASVMSSVPPSKLGVAGGINALVRNVGMVLGIAFSVTLFENRQADVLAARPFPSVSDQTTAFMSGYHTVLIIAAGIALAAAIISLNRRGYARKQST